MNRPKKRPWVFALITVTVIGLVLWFVARPSRVGALYLDKPVDYWIAMNDEYSIVREAAAEALKTIVSGDAETSRARVP